MYVRGIHSNKFVWTLMEYGWVSVVKDLFFPPFFHQQTLWHVYTIFLYSVCKNQNGIPDFPEPFPKWKWKTSPENFQMDTGTGIPVEILLPHIKICICMKITFVDGKRNVKDVKFLFLWNTFSLFKILL